MAPTPGLLFVTMQPADDLPAAQFHDWYNNEHGPTRLRLPYFQNGYRYLTTNGSKPSFLATYKVDEVERFGQESYTLLREPAVKSTRETDTMARISIHRRLYQRVHLKEKAGVCANTPGSILLGLAMTDTNHGKSLLEWHDTQTQTEQLPGWIRTQLYKSSALDTQNAEEYLTLHEFDNSSSGSDRHALLGISNELAPQHWRGPWTWERFYTFGPAPKDLESLASSDAAPFVSNDARTKTMPSPNRPAIESYITTSDGAILPYRLEGSPSPEAPLLVLVNSILVDWGIWDGFVHKLLKSNSHYRVLRYNSRGRTGEFGTAPVTLDLLVADLLEVLDALSVSEVAAAIGVSLGGATVLNAALQHSDRIPAFIACDTNAKAPEANSKAWGERIAVADREMANAGDRRIVGEEMAEMTTRRWFVEASDNSGATDREAARVKEMVRANDLEGFRSSVRALYQYDMKHLLASATAKGTFIVGEGDGVLPKTMREMADQYGSGAKLETVPRAGHLPMVENPLDFTEAVLRALHA